MIHTISGCTLKEILLLNGMQTWYLAIFGSENKEDEIKVTWVSDNFVSIAAIPDYTLSF